MKFGSNGIRPSWFLIWEGVLGHYVKRGEEEEEEEEKESQERYRLVWIVWIIWIFRLLYGY